MLSNVFLAKYVRYYNSNLADSSIGDRLMVGLLDFFQLGLATDKRYSLSFNGKIVNIAGSKYSFTRGSDVVRDGMFLEAELLEGEKRRAIAEVFYSDDTGKFVVSCFEENIPMELIEYLVAEGRQCLPPSAKP